MPPLLTSQPKKPGIGDAERRYDLKGWNGKVRAGALKADVDPPFGKGHPQHPLPSDGVGRSKERWDETEVWGLGKNRVSPIPLRTDICSQSRVIPSQTPGAKYQKERMGRDEGIPRRIVYFAGGGAQQVAIDKNAAQGS